MGLGGKVKILQFAVEGMAPPPMMFPHCKFGSCFPGERRGINELKRVMWWGAIWGAACHDSVWCWIRAITVRVSREIHHVSFLRFV